MNKMTNKFVFHNVGQGLFHTGQLGDFKFVFDCGTGSGSKNYITDAISDYKNKLNNNYLDLLIISHFHRDHINKLDELLDGLQIDTVVIPYFRMIERLFFALKNPTQDSWTYHFLADPARFLLERGVQNVILISQGGPSASEEIPTNLPDQEDPKKNRFRFHGLG